MYFVSKEKKTQIEREALKLEKKLEVINSQKTKVYSQSKPPNSRTKPNTITTIPYFKNNESSRKHK